MNVNALFAVKPFGLLVGRLTTGRLKLRLRALRYVHTSACKNIEIIREFIGV